MENNVSSHALGVVDPLFPDCPVRNVLSRVGDKWSLLVMKSLADHDAPMRFSLLRRSLPDISQKVLTATLRTLGEDGFVRREAYAEVPPRVEYALTARAESFLAACEPMLRWTLDHMAAIVGDRERNMRRG